MKTAAFTLLITSLLPPPTTLHAADPATDIQLEEFHIMPMQ